MNARSWKNIILKEAKQHVRMAYVRIVPAKITVLLVEIRESRTIAISKISIIPSIAIVFSFFILLSACRRQSESDPFQVLPFLQKVPITDSLSLAKLKGFEYSADVHVKIVRPQDKYWQIIEDPDYAVYEFIQDSVQIFFLEKFLKAGTRKDPNTTRIVDILRIGKIPELDFVDAHTYHSDYYPQENLIVHSRFVGPVTTLMHLRCWRIDYENNQFEEISTDDITWPKRFESPEASDTLEYSGEHSDSIDYQFE